MKLIDVETVISLWDKYHFTIATHAIEFDEELRKLPTVDAEPVRHGKWVQRFIKIVGQDFKHGMQCSVCGEPALDSEGDDYLTDYCPFCGARMDAE